MIGIFRAKLLSYLDRATARLQLTSTLGNNDVGSAQWPANTLPQGIEVGSHFYLSLFNSVHRPLDPYAAATRLALQTYGRHHDDCQLLQGGDSCTCKFAHALAQTHGDELLDILTRNRGIIETLEQTVARFARKELRELMSSLSSVCYGQRWYPGIEYELWTAVTSDSRSLGDLLIRQHDVNRLRSLSQLAGGWIVWDADNECEAFLPESKWLLEYSRHVRAHVPTDYAPSLG